MIFVPMDHLITLENVGAIMDDIFDIINWSDNVAELRQQLIRDRLKIASAHSDIISDEYIKEIKHAISKSGMTPNELSILLKNVSAKLARHQKELLRMLEAFK